MEWWVEPNWGLTMAGRRHLLRPAGSGGRVCGLFVFVIVLLFLENKVYSLRISNAFCNPGSKRTQRQTYIHKWQSFASPINTDKIFHFASSTCTIGRASPRLYNINTWILHRSIHINTHTDNHIQRSLRHSTPLYSWQSPPRRCTNIHFQVTSHAYTISIHSFDSGHYTGTELANLFA